MTSHQIEIINKKIEIIKKNQMGIQELKITIVEVKNSLAGVGVCSRVDMNWQKKE